MANGTYPSPFQDYAADVGFSSYTENTGSFGKDEWKVLLPDRIVLYLSLYKPSDVRCEAHHNNMLYYCYTFNEQATNLFQNVLGWESRAPSGATAPAFDIPVRK